jgi:hypothetical protein
MNGRPEIMCHPVESAAQLDELLARADGVVVGPGLGRSAWSKELWQRCRTADLPLVVDADALNLLAEEGWQRANWILTPHPGEAGRLLGRSTAQVQLDRIAAVRELADRYAAVAVLKGACSLVACAVERIDVCDRGNPGMATAGMICGIVGIVLCWFPFVGLIAGLLGIIFGAIGMSRAGRLGGLGRGAGVTGLVCGIISFLLLPIMAASIVPKQARSASRGCSAPTRSSCRSATARCSPRLRSSSRRASRRSIARASAAARPSTVDFGVRSMRTCPGRPAGRSRCGSDRLRG